MRTPLTLFMCLKFLVFLIMPMITNISRIRDTLIITIGSKLSLLGMVLYVDYSFKYHLYH